MAAVEVEFTPKTLYRYRAICTDHDWRLAREGISQVSYYCTDKAACTRILVLLRLVDANPESILYSQAERAGT
jgi:hypothetical protein